MQIYIIRHGETNANKEGRMQGQSDWELNDFGIRLAEETGRALKGVHFDAAFSSTLKRAEHTARIILKESGNNCPVFFDNRVIEINMGNYEGKRFRGPDDGIDPMLTKQFFDDPIHAPSFPQGEDVIQVMARTQEFLKELAQKDYDTVLVSTHGCALRAMLNFLYEDKNDFWHGHVPYNCVINIVESSNGQLALTGDDIVLYSQDLCVDRYKEI